MDRRSLWPPATLLLVTGHLLLITALPPMNADKKTRPFSCLSRITSLVSPCLSHSSALQYGYGLADYAL